MNTFIDNDNLFLDEETLKSILPSTRNITDTQTIYYSISMSQKRIKTLIGTPMYLDILSKWTNHIVSGGTLSTCDDELIHYYIQPILAFSSYKRLINHLSFKLKEGGLRYSIDTTTELADVSDRELIMRDITGDIDVFIKDMKQYIYDNKNCFPLYKGDFSGICVENKVSLNIGKV